jgi:cytochrome c peroxidase
MGHAGLQGFMQVGIAMLAIGFAVLLLMVQFELGPLANLTTGRKWGLTLMLGSGMVAFSIKLAIIAILAGYPEQTIRPQITMQKTLSHAEAWGNRAAPIRRTSDGPRAYVWRALPETAPAPAGNPTMPEKVALGERLFHDANLSINGEVSCSSCHDVKKGAGVDRRPTSIGVGGQIGNRNAPTVWNAAFQSVLFWDGRAASLEAVERRVREDESYRAPFAKAFGGGQPVTIDRIAEAIAAYERTLITPDAPYDRFVRGDEKALSTAQLRGMELFQSVGCILCHSGPNFSGASVFDPPPATQRIFPVVYSSGYMSRYRLTGDVGANASGSKRGVWRIPSLRNVALTAPYFHNGSVDNLTEAVRIMATVQRGKRIGNDAGERTVVWSKRERTISRVETVPLSERDVDDIVAFLKSLSSDTLSARGKGAS